MPQASETTMFLTVDVTGSSDYSLSQNLRFCQLPHQGAKPFRLLRSHLPLKGKALPSSLRKVESSQTKTDGVIGISIVIF